METGMKDGKWYERKEESREHEGGEGNLWHLWRKSSCDAFRETELEFFWVLPLGGLSAVMDHSCI